jgi:putative addiction module component (TIGR02574 family)
MSEKVEKVLQAALELTREERSDFLGAFQSALVQEGGIPPLDDEWLAEIERRSQAYERGEMKTYSWAEVRDSVRDEFKDRD